MQRAVGVPTTVVDSIQGLVVIFVAASLAFRFEQSRWAELWRRRKELDKALAPPAPAPKAAAQEGAER
jgi:simple sugar transport system permease protein